MIRNMLGILARKNIALSSKLEYLSRRTIREKLCAYLSDMAKRAGGSRF
jgi:CRP-like cAMP-binding protein